MGTIVSEGRQDGVFRDVNPLLACLTTVWPIMVYLVAEPVRRVIHRQSAFETSRLKPEAFIRHMQEVGRRSLAADPVPRRSRHAVHRHTESAP
jgi:hypothetical protein